VASILLSTSVVLMSRDGHGRRRSAAGIVPRYRRTDDANPGTATLAPFTLFGWVSPPVDFTTPERYTEMAQAGLNTTVLAWEDPGTLAFNRARLQFSRPVGVRNLLLDLRLDGVHEEDPSTFALLDSITSAYRDDAAFLGYYLGDEPHADEFPRLAEWFRLLRSSDPAHRREQPDRPGRVQTQRVVNPELRTSR
jgi:hypothetical protein